MSLEDLEKDIYRRGYTNDRRMKTAYDPDDTREQAEESVEFDSEQWEENPPAPKTLLDRFKEAFRKYWKIGLGVIVLLILVFNISRIGALFFTPDRVFVELSGPTEVASGEEVTYRVLWKNTNTLGAQNAELSVTLPESFRIGSSEGFSVEGNTMRMFLGDLGPRGSGEIRFSGKFYGSKGELSYIRSNVRFSPYGLSSQFDTRSQRGITIASSPLFLDTIVPLEAASGNTVEYVINYKNESDIPYPNVRIRAEYPDGFRFAQAVPQQTEGDNIWRLGNILPGATGEIRIRGTLYGESDQAKLFRAAIGVLQGDGDFVAYEQEERSTRMIVSPFFIAQQVNGRDDLSAQPGDMLRYVVSYVNQGDIGLRDAIITVEIPPDLLDMTRLSAERGGFYDGAKSVLVWNASVLPELARVEPNEGGTVRFSVPLRKDIPTTPEGERHLSVKTLAKIDSPDIPFLISSNKVIASNLLEVRVGSVFDFSVSGFHTETDIPNTGPIPPKVGEETTYMLRFRAVNYLNDLSDAKVTIILPPGVRYTGQYLPESEPILFNERTGELVWSIGSMFGGGRSARELSIQVAVVPGPDKIGETMELLQRADFEARDTFTDEIIRASSDRKTSALTEDGGIPYDGGVVLP